MNAVPANNIDFLLQTGYNKGTNRFPFSDGIPRRVIAGGENGNASYILDEGGNKMAFFDELGKVLTDKSKEAAGKVKDLTGVLQLKSKLSAEKDKVNQAYITLGKAYYDRHEASLEDEYAAELQVIRAGLLKMAELEDEIAELEGARVCAECGARVGRDALYCSRCGAAMEGKTASAEKPSCAGGEAEADTEAGGQAAGTPEAEANVSACGGSGQEEPVSDEKKESGE